MDSLKRLYALSPKGMKFGLDRIRMAAGILGDPQDNFKSIQIAGTNGKGTVSRTVAHAAFLSGKKTGLFTSPHLHRFSERIQINGVEIDSKALDEVLAQVLNLDVSLTFFEVATLAAALFFAQQRVELAVFEVGLGGRLDSTSIVNPLITAITSIGLDHTDLLGDTIKMVASEKVAIARPKIPMITGPVVQEARLIIEEHTNRINCPLQILGRDFEIPKDMILPWPGRHQRENAAVALQISNAMGIKESVFHQAISTVTWPGRFEILNLDRRYILDGAHNLEAVLALTSTLKETNEKDLTIIFGSVEGKPASNMLDILEQFASQVILVKPPIARAIEPTALAKDNHQIFESVEKGLKAGQKLDNTILITGSLFTMAEARRILLNEPSDPPIRL